MGHYNFEKDYKEALVVEKEAAAKIRSYFTGAESIEFNNDSDYDILAVIRSEDVTFEVKNELKVNETGNVAIEYFSRGKDSGIRVTKADYWVEKIKGDFLLMRTRELKQKIKDEQYDDMKSGGDPGSGTCFYLVKEARFRSWCEKM